MESKNTKIKKACGFYFWWPAIFRLTLFSGVAGFTIILAQMDKMTYEQTQQYVLWDWVRFFGPAIIVMANQVIGFFDQTLARLVKEKELIES
jgi:hypothetical protein